MRWNELAQCGALAMYVYYSTNNSQQSSELKQWPIVMNCSYEALSGWH